MMEQWHLGNAGRRQDDHVHTNRLLEWPWPIRRQVFHRDATPVVNVTHNNLDNIPKPINSIDLTEEIPNVLPHCLRKGPRSICDLRAIHWMADHVMSANTNHQFERSVASFFFYLYLSFFLSLGRPLDDSSFFFLFFSFFFFLFLFSIVVLICLVFLSLIFLLLGEREREREREVFIGNDQHVILIEFTSALVI